MVDGLCTVYLVVVVLMYATRAAQKSEGGLYATTAITVTMIQVKAFNHLGLHSIGQLLTNGFKDINPFP